MDIRHWSRKTKRTRIYDGIKKAVMLALLSLAAIGGGIAGGSLLYDMDVKTVGNIDTDMFKKALNNSMPLIDTVYNSGNAGISFTDEISRAVYGLFGFDISNPVTILNSQSMLFYSYYDNGYKQMLAQQEKKTEEEVQKTPESVTSIGTGTDTGTSADTAAPDDSETTNYLTDESSISYTEKEEKDRSENNVVSSGKIAILNETKYKIDIEALLKEPLNIKFDRKGPKILIYHTHTTESFLSSLNDLQKGKSGSRTRDPRYNVVRVGEELAQALRKKYGFEVIHNGTVHDYPNYNSSYSNSLNTISKILKSYPSIKVTIDLHRDALGGSAGPLRAVTKVDGKNAAQVMFVVGTDQNGLKNPNWRNNLKLALKLQQKLNQIAPNLAKPIDLSANRYNEHVTNGGSLLIEIGGDGNVISECLESTKYVAQALNDVLNGK